MCTAHSQDSDNSINQEDPSSLKNIPPLTEAEILYADIIHLPHHVSRTHPPMPMLNRAAQFSPFAALTGYEEQLRETRRLTDERPELDEDRQAELTETLRQIAAAISVHPQVTITYFLPDTKKEGGSYQTVSGRVKCIKETRRVIILYAENGISDGTGIPLDDVTELTITE